MCPLLKATNLRKSFGEKVVLDRLSLTVEDGEAICILGESGCGKTTLLRCLNLLEHTDSGLIEHRGTPVIAAGPETEKYNGKFMSGANRKPLLFVDENLYRQHFGIVFQSFNLFPNLTVLQNVIEGPVHVQRKPRREVIERARSLLNQMGISGKESAWPNQLSGGQQQRVAIARALAMDPDILLLDEITSALDPPRVAELLRLISELRKTESKAMVIVTHHIEFAKDVADRICFVHQGRIVEEGSPSLVFSEPKSDALKMFLETVVASR
ncbi:MAG: amino acid ABC transporter ATP-binding protein [Verrucomicrobia bacterium]|nr:amino acid ABC transporter ATP-binding protein [Verrucomicrobiota bacterium]